MPSHLHVPILMLHKVAPRPRGTKVPGHYVRPSLFQSQMRMLRALGFRTTPLRTLFEAEMPKRPLVITFDDGYRNFYDNALPVLRQIDFGATVFLVANQIGGTNEWDTRLGDVKEELLSEEQIRESAPYGIEFGSHTMDHAHLDTLPPDEAWHQIRGSKERLEQLLGHEISTFCYPYGGKKPETEAMVRRAGYSLACSTRGGLNTPYTNRFELRRVNVRSNTTPVVLLYKLLRDFRRG